VLAEDFGEGGGVAALGLPRKEHPASVNASATVKSAAPVFIGFESIIPQSAGG
jgi:hypothetical protein